MTPESVAEFQTRVRQWLAANVPDLASGDNRGRDIETAKRVQSGLYDAGLAGISWPAEYGGQGLPKAYEGAFREEAVGYALSTEVFAIGFGMCGPVLLTLGSEEQKRRYIPELLRGDEVWCQLFSEPGAGSDVAGLQSSAVAAPEGGWVLNGQKVWTTVAQLSDFGIIVARTDPDVPKHAGLSMFIVDMHAPGVTVRPLRQMNGGTEFNEVFFDDVHIPAENLVGELNNGWHAATVMLMHERVSIGGGGGLSGRQNRERLYELAREHGADTDPVLRQRLVDLYIHERSIELLGLRIREQVKAGKNPGPIGSSAKLALAELAAAVANLAIDIVGPDAVAWENDDVAQYSTALLGSPAIWIAGGTSDIQRNIIAERILGLPREPRVDKDVPFRELKVGPASNDRPTRM